MPMSVDLGASIEEYLSELVAAGRFDSRSDALREGVRLLKDRDARIATLDESIARGVADMDAGRVVPAEDLLQELTQRYRNWPKKTGS